MMQLYYSPTSPFSRKVRVVLRELQLEKQISEILIDPWTDEALRAHNPLAKVPTLILDDGMAVFESAVICDYLDQVAKSAGLSGGVIPENGSARLNALKWQGLADGMMAATGRLFADSNRAEQDRCEDVMERQAQAITSGIEAIIDGLPAFGPRMRILAPGRCWLRCITLISAGPIAGLIFRCASVTGWRSCLSGHPLSKPFSTCPMPGTDQQA